MSYPQPDTSLYAASGAKFFRLNTQLVSDGDIYESAVGAEAFAIGPDSDIPKVNLAYFDDQAPNFLQDITITPQRPFSGLVRANNTGRYAPAQRPGRILMWPDAVFAADFDPSAIATGVIRTDMIPPTMDVIQYFGAPPALTTGRNDKRYYYEQLPVGGVNSYFLGIPYYGRKYASIVLLNGTVTTCNIDLYGVTFPMNRPGGLTLISPLGTIATAFLSASTKTISETDGQFDYLLLKLGFTTAPTVTTFNLAITTSDKG